MFKRLNKRGQSTLEYAVLIVVIVAGLLTMQMFMKRGYQGRLRSASDDIGEQFSPEHTTYTYNLTSDMSGAETTTQVDGTQNTGLSQKQSRTGEEEIESLSSEDWLTAPQQ